MSIPGAIIGIFRRMQAAGKQQQREALKQQKELERRLKEQAKLSAFEQARIEVEAHENALEVLLSVHKQQSEPFDWGGLCRCAAAARAAEAGAA